MPNRTKLKVLTTGETNHDTEQPVKPTREETMTQTPTRILIKLHQGNVQAVGCSAPNAHVVIVDWDTDGSNPHDESLVRIDRPYAPIFARVYRFPACSLDDFQGTEAEDAIGVKELSSFSNLSPQAYLRNETAVHVVITVHHACVQSVSSSDANAEAVIVDLDAGRLPTTRGLCPALSFAT